jgi:hypothetical protein
MSQVSKYSLQAVSYKDLRMSTLLFQYINLPLFNENEIQQHTESILRNFLQIISPLRLFTDRLG